MSNIVTVTEANNTVTVTPSSNKVTVTQSIPTITLSTPFSKVGAAQNVFTRLTDGSNVAEADNASDTFTFTGTSPITATVTAGTDTLTVAATDASTSAKGVASFASADFAVSSGAVSLVDLTTTHIASGSLDTDLSSVSGSDDTLASAKAVKTYVDAQVTAQDLDFTTDTAGNSAVDLDTQTLSVLGGEGIDVTHSGQTITVAGELATSSNKGVASFSDADFGNVSSAVNVKPSYVQTTGTIAGSGGADITNITTTNINAGDLLVGPNLPATNAASSDPLTVYQISVVGSSNNGTIVAGNNSTGGTGSGTYTFYRSGTITKEISKRVVDLDADLSSVSSSDDTLASAKAIKAYVDAQVATEDTISELNDTTITGTPADNEVLAYDSGTSMWINQTAAEAGVATSSDFTAHTGNTSNPHSVTKTQVGLSNVENTALTTWGGNANISSEITAMAIALG